MLILTFFSFWFNLFNVADAIFDCNLKELQSDDLQANIRWTTFINENLDSLSQCYVDQAVKISPDGTVALGRDEIISHYRDLDLFIRSIKTTAKIEAHEQRRIHYEIGEFQTDSGDDYTHVIIWQGHGAKGLRELEFVAPADPGSRIDMEELDQRRNLWMELCNEHKVEELVAKMYAEHPIYYNHKPLVLSAEELIEEYAYMTRPQYTLHLKPLHTEIVNQGLVYEIGQCSGSYGGKYLIIWQRKDGGTWKVLVDSNI